MRLNETILSVSPCLHFCSPQRKATSHKLSPETKRGVSDCHRTLLIISCTALPQRYHKNLGTSSLLLMHFSHAGMQEARLGLLQFFLITQDFGKNELLKLIRTRSKFFAIDYKILNQGMRWHVSLKIIHGYLVTIYYEELRLNMKK